MPHRGTIKQRCARCHLHECLCICPHIPRLSTRTRLVVVIHRSEVRKPTNSGGLATLCLENSELWEHGRDAPSQAPLTLAPGTRPVLLYPSRAATPLSEFVDSSVPITLCVPDGTWRQASRVRRRVPALADLPLASLPDGPASEYRLRSDARAGRLATMEAIARAFGVLEGRTVQDALESVFRMMVERTLWSRGSLPAAEVLGGIPEEARRPLPDLKR